MATTVNSNTTIKARIVSGLVWFAGLLVLWGVLPVEAGAAVVSFLEGRTFELMLVSFLWTMNVVLPAVQKWQSRDKELPEGVKITEVVLAPEASQDGAKVEALVEAQERNRLKSGA